MKKNYFKIFSFFAGVVDTADKHSFTNISANFRKNLKWSYWDTGAWGTLIYKKNLMSKISCQTPFNLLFLFEEKTH